MKKQNKEDIVFLALFVIFGTIAIGSCILMELK